MEEWLNTLLFALVPGTCILCGARTGRHFDLCAACEYDLPRVRHPCEQCGLPLGSATGTAAGTMAGTEAPLCGQCLVSPPVFTRCFAPFVYTWPIDKLINDFKNHNHIILGKMLAHAMARAYVADTWPDHLPDTLLPVPLHKRRLRARGFNQSLEIAEVLADTSNARLDNRLCRRVIDVAQQKSLNARQRKQNLGGAFVLDRIPEGEHIAIVDDVVTTGATVSEIGRLLLSHGALRVDVIALARTLR